MVTKPLTKNIDMSRPPLDIAAYEASDGYQSIKAIAEGLSPDNVMQIVKDFQRGSSGVLCLGAIAHQSKNIL